MRAVFLHQLEYIIGKEEEINLDHEINKDHINTFKNIMDKLSDERVTTETYRESLKMIDSLYQERLSLKKF
jgi:hypothetical protein